MLVRVGLAIHNANNLVMRYGRYFRRRKLLKLLAAALRLELLIAGIELEVLRRLFRLALFEGLLQLFAHLSIFLVGAGVRDSLLLLEVLGKSAVAGPELGGDLEILLEVVLRHSDVAEHRAFRQLLEGLGVEQDLCLTVLIVVHDLDIR